MKKIHNIQALRGIAVLSVVLFHILIIEQKYGGPKTIIPGFFKFGIFGVDLFFVISGFIMVAVTKEIDKGIEPAFRFLYHRASRIYPTYWVYSTLVLIIFLMSPSLVNSSQGNKINIVASFLLFPTESLPLVMVGWTLIHEMYFYLVIFFTLLWVPKKYQAAFFLLWGMIVTFLNIFVQPATPLVKLISSPLTIEFIGGCFIAKLFFKATNRRLATQILFIMASTGLIASIYGFDLYQKVNGQIDPLSWWRVLIFGAPAMLGVFCFIEAERNGNIIHPSLIKIGDASYSTYLSHVLTLSAAGRVWHMFSTNDIYDNIVMIPVLFAIVVGVGFISYRFVEKPLLTISRKIG